MHTLYIRSLRSPLAALLMSLMLGSLAPATALAASSSTRAAAEDTASASFELASLSVDSGERPRISGTATSTDKVRFAITEKTEAGKAKTVYKSRTLKVRDHHWAGSVSRSAAKRLDDGTYTVTVYDYDAHGHPEIAEGTLYVGVPRTVLKVVPIPLLFGSVAHAGALVPVSYLEVINRSAATTSIAGFWLEQDGTAPVSAIAGFSSVDGKGGSRAATGGAGGAALFKNGKAFVPSTAVLAPGEMRLFTLKAQLSPLAAQQAAGRTLMLNVAGVDTGGPATFQATFPIRGTTWTVGA